MEEKKEAMPVSEPLRDDFLPPKEEKASCMKCGREMPAGRAFCEECLADMERYQVPSDMPVVIPARPESSPARRAKQRRERKPEEQNRILRRMVLWISLIAVLLAVVGGVAIAILTGRLQDMQAMLPQHNNSYSTNDQLTTR